jgi:hypothetical protein
MYSLIRL